MIRPRLKAAVISAFFVASMACSDASRNVSGPAKDRIVALSQSLTSDVIGEIEILQITPFRESVAGISPEDLASDWEQRFTIRDIGRRGAARDKLARVLRQTHVYTVTNMADLRWGFVFKSSKDPKAVVGRLYFDSWGRGGVVDDIPVAFDESLLPELVDALHPSLAYVKWWKFWNR
jgi:hypothetical protein